MKIYIIETVKQNGHALEYVKKQTPEICMEAFKNDCSALEFVKEQTPEICMEAVIRNGLTLKCSVRLTSPQLTVYGNLFFIRINCAIVQVSNVL